MITQQVLEKSYSYKSYKDLLETLLAQGKTTGKNQSEEFLSYAKINLQRMDRLEKTITLSEQFSIVLPKITGAYIWLLITEGWCGDASQNLPVFDLIARFGSAIDLKLILRDEHPDIMEQYLTNGSRSIPKLICLEKRSLKEIFVWGPRPAILQQLVLDLLAKGVTKEEKGLLTQKWYNADKTKSLQGELLVLLKKLI